jgi:hypothetical protein
MFSVIRGAIKNSAKNVEDTVGFACNRTAAQIMTDLESVSNLIRNNIDKGLPCHTNLLQQDFAQEDTRYCAALLAEVYLNELVFCLNTINCIQLITGRYHEEEVTDKREWEEDQGDDDFDFVETLPMTKKDIPAVSTKLADDLLIGSGLIYRSFSELLQCLGPCLSILAISTSNLRRGCLISLFERFSISIVSASSDKPSVTHGQFIDDLTRLFEISQQSWRMMSMFAFSNLFRYMEGSTFAKNPIVPEDSIFANRGRFFKPKMGNQAVSNFPNGE